MSDPFANHPECCRKLLASLKRDQRRGSRNCSQGHLVSVELALHQLGAGKPAGASK